MKLSRIALVPRAVAVGLAASVAGALLINGPAASATTDDGSTGSAAGSLGSLAVTTGVASSGSHKSSPYITDVRRVVAGGRTAVRVTPTEAGRTSWGPADEAEAWAELVALAPDAATPGMRQQFTCHWIFARVVEPERGEWSLEPWRPSVSDAAMIAAGCNPELDVSSGS